VLARCHAAATLLLGPLAAQHRWSLPSELAPRPQPVAIQDVARRDVAGSARGSDGAPWLDASVVLYSPAVPPLPELAPADEVTTRTDQRGRFRAALRHPRGRRRPEPDAALEQAGTPAEERESQPQFADLGSRFRREWLA